MRGIEPLYSAWKAVVLPLNYVRKSGAPALATGALRAWVHPASPGAGHEIHGSDLVHRDRWEVYRRLHGGTHLLAGGAGGMPGPTQALVASPLCQLGAFQSTPHAHSPVVPWTLVLC